MALYPPIMASSQDAFLAASNTQSIYFTLSTVTTREEIGHVQIKVVFQSNNKSASNKFPDGIIYKDSSLITSHGNGLYSIPILYTDLTGGWQANKYYKVQLCFGKSPLWTGDISNFAAWKANQILLGYNSEWSTVMVLKAINETEIRIINQEGLSSDFRDDSLSIESSILTELTTTPLFQGMFQCNGEVEDKYKFDLYQGGEMIESSGWLQHNSSSGFFTWVFVDTHRFAHILSDGQTYTVKYAVETVNGYVAEAEEYTFLVNENFLTALDGVSLRIDDRDEPYGNENGVIRAYLSSDHPLLGNYVLTRSSEKSGFGVWEDLKYFVFSNKTCEDDLIYSDFTIESGVKYKYAIQQENNAGLRTRPIYEKPSLPESPERMVDFQYSYLFADGVQLKLRFDQKMNSFKHTVLASKQDTLGSRYPTIHRNGDAYYAEFPVSGLISLHLDDDQTFFTLDTDGNYCYKGEKVIMREKHTDIVFDERTGLYTEVETFDHNLIDNNYYIERIFREKVEEFLNDGGYKLYKSPTEGNIVVTLMNVQFTPNETLGRLIFSFSATAYEVLENTISNLNEYGIIDIGHFKQDISGVDENGNPINTLLIGQISGLFGTATNLVDVIKADNEYDIGGGYQYSFERLASIQIEGYPRIQFTDKINELEAKFIQAKTDNNEELMQSLRAEITSLKTLEAAANKQVLNPIVTVYINGKEVSLGANRIYQLKDTEVITSIKLKHNEPVIVNYTCYVSSKESESSTISAITTTSAWGQLAGVFTTTEKVLDNYVFNRPSDSFRVPADYNYNLYQSLDITEIIKEEVRHEVERRYGTTFHLDRETGQWTDGKYYYVFQQFTGIELEADEGTTFLVTNKEDGEVQEIVIGATNKYRLQNLDSLVASIKLRDPSFVIVNYRCLTMQMTMGVS